MKAHLSGFFTLVLLGSLLLLLPSQATAFRILNVTPVGYLAGSEHSGTYNGGNTIDGDLGGSGMWEEHWPAPGQDGSSPNGNEWGIAWDMGSSGWNFTKAWFNVQNPTYCSAPCNVLNAQYGTGAPGVPPTGYTALTITGANYFNTSSGGPWFKINWNPPTSRGQYFYVDGNAWEDGTGGSVGCKQLSTGSCTNPYSGMGSGGGGGMTGLWEVILEVQKDPVIYALSANTSTILAGNSIVEFTVNVTKGTEIPDKLWINVTSTANNSRIGIITYNSSVTGSTVYKMNWSIAGFGVATYTATAYANWTGGGPTSLDAVTVTITGLSNGAACTTGGECNSGFCTDGVCCNSGCAGTCQRCDLAGTNGSCTNTPLNFDYDNECGTAQCGKGNCNGNGVCDFYTSGEQNCPTCSSCAGANSESCVTLADNTQDITGSNLCSSTCKKCLSGSCIAQGNEDLFNQCAAAGCSTGLCQAGNSTCGWYTSGEGLCPTCSSCDGATSSTCIVMSNNTQDSAGSNLCSSTCKKCMGGSCVNQGNEDLFAQCDTANCGTGNCQDGTGFCNWYATGERNCPVCQTCESAFSTACVNLPSFTQDILGSNLCDQICKTCDGSGSCVNQPPSVDYFGQCTPSADCNTGMCNGGGACDWYTSGEGACPPCQTCNGATSLSCKNFANDTQDTQGGNTCSSTCKKCVGGSCVDQSDIQDLFDQCTTVECDAGATPSYYFGWSNTTCYYMADIANGVCNGTAGCWDSAHYCPSSTIGDNTSIVCGCGEAAIIGCSGTTVGSCNNTLCFSPPNATGVHVDPSPAFDTDDLTCDYVFVDPWGHPENLSERKVRWYKNGTFLTELNDFITISEGNTTTGDPWMCSVSVANLHNQSGYFTSPEVFIGDDIPPYNSTAPTISALTQCSENGSSTVRVNITDDGSNVETVYLEVTTPTDTLNLTMDCSPTKPSECTKVLSGYSASFSTNTFYFADSSNNWAYLPFNNTIDVHTCTITPGGGGGGGGAVETVYFRVYPRQTTTKGDHPSDAVIVGDQSLKYVVVPKVTNTQIQIFVQPAAFKNSANVQVNSTEFFKVDPMGSVRMNKDNISIVVYCDIPDQYRFQPYGIFNTSVIVKKEGAKFQEAIAVTCESQEHYEGAGSLSSILNQPIPYLGISIGETWFIAIGIILVVSYRANLKKRKR